MPCRHSDLLCLVSDSVGVCKNASTLHEGSFLQFHVPAGMGSDYCNLFLCSHYKCCERVGWTTLFARHLESFDLLSHILCVVELG